LAGSRAVRTRLQGAFAYVKRDKLAQDCCDLSIACITDASVGAEQTSGEIVSMAEMVY